MFWTLKIITLALLSFSLTASDIVKRALCLSLPMTNTITIEDVSIMRSQAMAQVMACDYEKALEIIILGMEQFPHNFCLQNCFAALLGDHSENFTGILRQKMERKSKDCFNKLMKELEGQEITEIYRFKNEYFFRFAEHKKQYDNGTEMVSYYNNPNNFSSQFISSGYYYQGVGAAHHGKQLLIENKKEEALQYAQKALVAWAQYFSYKNDYYNSYVHYALALGILGHREEMLRALQRSAILINRDLTYHEFTEVIDFIDHMELSMKNTQQTITSHFTFKKLTQKDWPLLLQWFKEPHVEKWWPTPEENELMEYFLEKIRCKNTFGFVVFLDEKPIGYIQYYYIDRSKVESGSLLPPLPDETTVGIDQFIGDPNYLHKGYGTQFIKQFIADLPIIEPETTTVILDTNPENIAAIRCYEKVGFERVCTYQNPWGTSLVMRYDI